MTDKELIADAREAMTERDDTGWYWVGRLADALEASLVERDAALAAADAVCCAHPKCPGGSLCCCQSDAVVTEEMIAETILKALVFTNENSKPWADGLARNIAALFRGGAK